MDNAHPTRGVPVQRARTLRKGSTNAQTLLWRLLRSRQMKNIKFRRQQPIGPYIADLYCHEAALVIDLDGSQHHLPTGIERDSERTRYLESCGLTVLRFTNIEVLKETEGVLNRIWQELDRKFPSP